MDAIVMEDAASADGGLWLTVDEANTFFSTRLGSAAWSASNEQLAALTTAQNDLESCGRYDFPSEPDEDMKAAVCEQALFLLADDGIDARAGLRAQGVKSAGVVKEAYEGAGDDVAIAPRAALRLASYKRDWGAYSIELSRDDDA